MFKAERSVDQRFILNFQQNFASMWYLIITLAVIAAGIFLFFKMTSAFHTDPVDYTANPGDLGLEYRVVKIPTRNDLMLTGWWIPADDGERKPLLLLLHGWRRNMERMMPYIRALHGEYNLLAFDSRNHGKSGSDTFSSMPRFAEDIVSALNFVEGSYNRNFSGEIGIIGLSMGGAASIYAASRDNRLKGVVTVGAFASPAEVMRLEYRKRHIPYFPMVYLVFEYFQYHMKQRFSRVAPEKNIEAAEAHLLIVHGTNDRTAPFSHAGRLVTAARNGNAELLPIEGAGHSDCHEHESFWPAVKGFLERTLKK